MEPSDALLDSKRGLLKELSAKLAAAGSSQEVMAERLGIARPDVSAIHAGNTKRFTFERIVRMLQRLGSEINIDVVPKGRGGRVRGVSLEDLGLLSLMPRLHHAPGLTLIGGGPDHGQRELLTAILGEHARRGERTVLFTQGVWGSGLPVVPFRTDDDLMKWVVYN
ncbi:MAG: XRE family transcriptional regulator, partial [Candidatus Cybelea sp.]